MATSVEAALLAASVYHYSSTNIIPAPGWEIIVQQSESANSFGAKAYMRGDEIVIALRGTDDIVKDMYYANINASLGRYSEQVEEAMAFFFWVSSLPESQGKHISFTGHSLGGGLAALLGVYFDRDAYVFDEAPFAFSATNLDTVKTYQANLAALGMSDPAFDAYVASAGEALPARLNRVDGYYMSGEFLHNAPENMRLSIAPQAFEVGDASAFDLHSIKLLYLAMVSPTLESAIRNNEHFLDFLFDSQIYAKANQSASRDLASTLVQLSSQFGNEVLTALAADLEALADGGKAGAYARELTYTAMDNAFWTTRDNMSALFTAEGGGVTFRLSDIGPNSIDPAVQLEARVRKEASPHEAEYLPSALAADVWHIQSGGKGLSVADTGVIDSVVLGGATDDAATTGAGADLLLGGVGDDTLNGGGGQDTILGGDGADKLDGGDGADTLLGGLGDDDLHGGAHDDSLLGGFGKDILSGGDGADHLDGEFDDDLLLGFDGNDTLYGQGGDDDLDGGAGQDVLEGGIGNDTLFGGDGEDRLVGGNGDDVLHGADSGGGDTLVGGRGHDIYRVDDGDTIIDEDGKGEIWLNGKQLTTATRNKGETLYHDDAGNTYLLQGGRLLVNDPLVISGFSNGQFGIQLREENDDPDDPYDPPAKVPYDDALQAVSPIVLDLDGGGVATRGIGQGAFFDFDGNGFAERTAWAAPGDGILVRDRDGDGSISSGTELFGNHTPLTGGGAARDGYQALAELDTNGDGVIGAADAEWGALKVWRDADSDGTVDAGELATLDEAGIRQLSLQVQNGSGVDSHGNDHRYRSTFERLDGSVGDTVDIWFRVNPASSRHDTKIPVSEEILALPDADGMGNVASLHQALAADTSGKLRVLLDRYLAQGDHGPREAALKELLFAWAGVAHVAPDSRGSDINDARVLATVERFLAKDFIQAAGYNAGTPNPAAGASALITASFNELLHTVSLQLDSQTVFVDWLARVVVRWDGASERLVGSLDGLTPLIAALDEAAWITTVPHLIDTLRATYTLTPFSLEAFKAAMLTIDPFLAYIADQAWRGKLGTQQGDYIVLTAADERFGGLGGADTIHGYGGADFLDGGSESDHLDGGAGADTLFGGHGDDVLYGGAGADVYRYTPGDGRDTIAHLVVGDVDRLEIGGNILPSAVLVSRNLDDLVLVEAGGGQIVVLGYFDSDVGGLDIAFDDGTLWNLELLKARLAGVGTDGNDTLMGFGQADTLRGFAGNDVIHGRAGDDVMEGGDGRDTMYGHAGNDTLVGGQGDDTLYIERGDVVRIGAGDGHDVVYWNPWYDHLATVEFSEAIGSADLAVTFVDGKLRVTIGNNQQSVSIEQPSASALARLSFRFADGVVWSGTDVLSNVLATDGNDVLHAGANAIRSGAAGNDRIVAVGQDATLSGGLGRDTLEGGGQARYHYERGDGIDVIRDDGTGVLQLGPGISSSEVTVTRTGHQIELNLPGGRIVLDAEHGLVGRVAFSDGTSWSAADLLERAARATDGADYLVVTESARLLDGKAGNDTLVGSSLDDTLIGGAGNDTLNGSGGSDTYRFGRGDGVDTILEFTWSQMHGVIEFDASIAVQDIQVTNDGQGIRLAVKGTNDAIWLAYAGVQLHVRFVDGTLWAPDELTARAQLGGAMGDALYADAARPDLAGSAGNDLLFGNHAANRLGGGAGDDYLAGGGGDDIYVYDAGDGADRISDFTGNDVLVFGAAIRPEDIMVSLNATSVGITFRHIPGKIEAAISPALGVNSIDSVKFADGTVWSAARILAQRFVGSSDDDTIGSDGQANALVGLGGNDSLYGGLADDTLIGGAGDDQMYGSGGNDVYVIGLGHGNDVITDWDGYVEGSTDKVLFDAGIAESDVRVVWDGYLFNLLIVPSGQRITLANWFSAPYRIEQVQFANGAVWNTDALLARAMTGTDGNDALRGTSGAETMQGLAGNDSLDGLDGHDLLSGGAGADTLDGGWGSDTLHGGAGNDELIGGAGTNEYRYELGDGHDRISSAGSGQGGVLRLGAGIAPSDVTIQQQGANLALTIGVDGSVVLVDWFYWSIDVDQVLFADGTVWSKDYLRSYSVPGTDADDHLLGNDGANQIDAMAGNDYVVAGGGDDDLRGGRGDDWLYGGAGADTYRYDAGDGSDKIVDGDNEANVLLFGAAIRDGQVAVSRLGADLVLRLADSGDRIVVHDWFLAPTLSTIRFSDGTSWTVDEIERRSLQATNGDDALELGASNMPLDGLAGNDRLVGNGDANGLSGGLGDDTLYGNAGADTLAGGEGYDYLVGGEGDDVYLVDRDAGTDDIFDYKGQNIIRLGMQIAEEEVEVHQDSYGLTLFWGDEQVQFRSSGDGAVALAGIEFADGGNWDADAIQAARMRGSRLSDTINGTVGADVLGGRDGHDYLSGGAGDDVLDGGSGSDRLDGGAGDDVFLIALDDGVDDITVRAGEHDVVRFAAGIALADLEFRRFGDDLYIGMHEPAASASARGLWLSGWYAQSATLRLVVQFAYGETLSAAELEALTYTRGTSLDDMLSGWGAEDTLFGLGGNDTLSGWTGDDLLIGGAGNDELSGGYGADTYLYNPGDGQDVILDSDGINQGNVLRFGDGIAPDDVIVERKDRDLFFSLRGTDDRITLSAWSLWSEGGAIGRVEFADGTVWDRKQVEQRLSYGFTEGDDEVRAFELDEVLAGMGGDDIIYGEEGADTLIGGAGDDFLEGGKGDDVYRYTKGDGSDSLNYFAYDGSRDVLLFDGTIHEDDVQAWRDHYSLYLTIGDEEITLWGWFGWDGRGEDNRGGIEFADGTAWSVAATHAMFGATPDDDVLVADHAGAALDGLEGDDTLIGGNGSDSLDGGDGVDSLIGGGGNDTLDGGAGEAMYSGGAGNDLYRWNDGGYTLIGDWSTAAGEVDRLTIAGLAQASMVLRNKSNDLIITGPGGDMIRIVGYFLDDEGGKPKEGLLVFEDGTSWTRAEVIAHLVSPDTATPGDDELTLSVPGMLDGLDGDDHLIGVLNSTLLGSGGNDFLAIRGRASGAVLRGGDGIDRLELDVADGSFLHGDDGNDSLEVRGGTRVYMDGGDGADAVQWRFGTDGHLLGGLGDDYLMASDGSGNLLEGGAGRDTMMAHRGRDDRLFGEAGSDMIQVNDGINSQVFGGDDADTIMGYVGSGNRFDGGAGDDSLQFSGTGSGNFLLGGAGNDTLRGFTNDITLYGGSGNDTLEGNGIGLVLDGGDDTDLLSMGSGSDSMLDGGAGDDVLSIGGGHRATLAGGGGDDRLSVGMGNGVRFDGGDGDDELTLSNGSNAVMAGGEGDDLLDLGSGARGVLNGGAGNDVVFAGTSDAHILFGGEGNDTLTSEAGNGALAGGDGDDRLQTGAGNQLIAGGKGDDRILLQTGRDIVAFNRGDAADVISGDGGDLATLSLGGGIRLGELALVRDASHLVLDLGDGDRLQFDGWFNLDRNMPVVSHLQIMVDASVDYDPASTDPFQSHRVLMFDFKALAAAFEAAQADPGGSAAWSLEDALLAAHLSHGDNEAVGGALAVEYAHGGYWDDADSMAIFTILEDPAFGAAATRSYW